MTHGVGYHHIRKQHTADAKLQAQRGVAVVAVCYCVARYQHYQHHCGCQCCYLQPISCSAFGVIVHGYW
jgi:hypothetical protein